MIRLEKLHKYFRRGKSNEIHVINDITLDLPERGMVAIFGESGCGKTTLLNVIGGLDGFASGRVTVEGRDIRQDTDVLRNRYIGYIFQNYNLLEKESCFENVASALRLCGIRDEATVTDRVMAALENVCMEKFAKRTPDTLSGGQQQRIAIARAIVKNSKIILADEPTGNLDEANTVLVMDLLKEIAKDHLVLLVTHEAALVDYYCDKVIALSDGKVVGIRENEEANGYVVRNKNDIYLGELEKTELSNESVALSYYGDAPQAPIRMKIVNRDGKLYLSVETEGINVLERGSEIQLIEGVYRETERAAEKKSRIDMTRLPPVEGKQYGRLFTLGSALQSGYKENFKKQKLGKRALRRCMGFFAALWVLTCAVFGIEIKTLLEIDDKYNHNTFYLVTENAETSEWLSDAMQDRTAGIDAVYLAGYDMTEDLALSFYFSGFETFDTQYGHSLETNAVLLPHPLAEAKKTVAGTEVVSPNDLVITSTVADKLIASSSLGFVRGYGDLVGMYSADFSFEGKSMRIAGVVASGENAVYMHELALAENLRYSCNLSRTRRAAELGMDVAAGETILFVENGHDRDMLPAKGETVKIQGKDFLIRDKIIFNPKEDFSIPQDIAYSVYLVCDSDYVELSRCFGETHISAAPEIFYYGSDMDKDYYEDVYEGNGAVLDYEYGYFNSDIFAVVHSSRPSAAHAYLEKNYQGSKDIISPSTQHGVWTVVLLAGALSSLVTLGVLLALMCVCMYFIMRSSLLSRIREIGIYRAIGVSRKNLVFRFLVEAATLFSLTVLVGYLVTSGVLALLLNITTFAVNLLYYPVWFAILALLVLLVITLFFGTLPVLLLLRHKPSAILAKYDI